MIQCGLPSEQVIIYNRALISLPAIEVVHTREITERPHTPSGVAAFMSSHSKTQYITPSMGVSSGKGVVRGRRGQQLELALVVVPNMWGS